VEQVLHLFLLFPVSSTCLLCLPVPSGSVTNGPPPTGKFSPSQRHLHPLPAPHSVGISRTHEMRRSSVAKGRHARAPRSPTYAGPGAKLCMRRPLSSRPPLFSLRRARFLLAVATAARRERRPPLHAHWASDAYASRIPQGPGRLRTPHDEPHADTILTDISAECDKKTDDKTILSSISGVSMSYGRVKRQNRHAAFKASPDLDLGEGNHYIADLWGMPMLELYSV